MLFQETWTLKNKPWHISHNVKHTKKKKVNVHPLCIYTIPAFNITANLQHEHYFISIILKLLFFQMLSDQIQILSSEWWEWVGVGPSTSSLHVPSFSSLSLSFPLSMLLF